MEASNQQRLAQEFLSQGTAERWLSGEDKARWTDILVSQIDGLASRIGIDGRLICVEINKILSGLTLSSEILGLEVGPASVEGLADLDSRLSEEYCRQRGAYMTPAKAAGDLVELIPELVGGSIIDPACGHGELLLAARRRWPARDLVGVELHPGLAVVAALRIWEQDLRNHSEDIGSVRIHVGDGLALPEIEGEFAAVIGNPPYLGEKGQAAFFRELKQKYPRLAPIFSARMDLIYPFLARGVELVRPGGWNCWLTPPYWLYADGARGLRKELLRELEPRFFVELDHAGLFSAAPGDEFLMVALQRPERASTSVNAANNGRWWSGESDQLRQELARRAQGHDFGQEVASDVLSESGWHPFTPLDISRWRSRLLERGSSVEELARDFQGFVSGADRVSRRHIPPLEEGDVELKEPIFLADGPRIPDSWKAAPPGLLQPVLRSRNIEKNSVIRRTPKDAWTLYIDDQAAESFDDSVYEQLLGRFRPVLERRREVKRGLMPWYRLHWPRDREAMRGPKLVVPRRAISPRFTLDLSGAMISSDCTFIVAPEGTESPERYLCALMLLLNDERTRRYLHYFGKRKGRVLEFYSSPLRRLILPARRVEGRLMLDEEIFDREQRRAVHRRVQELLSDVQAG